MSTPPAPCFASGTGIATVTGAVAVEDLAIGDAVITVSGKSRPIRWIGHRTIECDAMPNPEYHYPVRVRAGAFGRNLPSRDLLLTGGHSVYAEGILVPISALENGVTIAREPVRRITYWHIELDSHDIILAEGLPTETYLDTGNRSGFDNHGGPVTLRPTSLDPDVDAEIWATKGCAPRFESGQRVTELRRRLLEEAQALGVTTTEAADIRLFADDVPLGDCWSDGWLNIGLPHGTRTLRILSRSARPVWGCAQNDDDRLLGIAISEALADGVALAHDGPAFVSGFHSVERDGDQTWRWTNGDATLEVAGLTTLKMRIATLDAYPIAATLTRSAEKRTA